MDSRTTSLRRSSFWADDALSGWITGVILPVDGGVTAGRNA
jgi:hypothetical protein